MACAYSNLVRCDVRAEDGWGYEEGGSGRRCTGRGGLSRQSLVAREFATAFPSKEKVHGANIPIPCSSTGRAMPLNPNDRKALLTRFFRALPDKGSTDAEENRQFYVDRKPSESSLDPVGNLMLRISMVEGAASYLFSGMRGSGKTTELVRMGRLLEEKDNCAVFYTDISDYINLRVPLGVEDTIFAMLGALSDAFELRFGIDLTRESYWTRAVHFLTKTNIKVNGWTIKASILEASAELKGSLNTDPTFRQNLRKALNSNLDAFLRDAREYTASLVKKALEKTKGRVKVVLIVDSLERVSAATGDEHKMFDGLKEVFFSQREKLRFDTLTVIYSVPPYLDAVIPGVANGFGGTYGLPHFKVGKLNSSGQFERSEDGIDQLIHVIDKRFVDWKDVLSRDTLAELAFQSGGNIRRYIDLIRDLLVRLQSTTFALPMGNEQYKFVEAVLQTAREPFQFLNEADRNWLRKIAKESKVTLSTQDELPTVLRLFDASLILDYRNGERWYQILPLVKPLLDSAPSPS